MVRAIEKMVEYLADTLDGVTVECGYKSDFINRPVMTCRVYISSGETEVDAVNGSFNFIAYVYSPYKDGGSLCLETAENVCEQLLKSGLSVCNLKVGKVSSNGSSGAFEVQISGSAADKSFCGGYGLLGACTVTAFDFEKDSDLSFILSVGRIRVDIAYQPYPIMTICSGKPIAVEQGAATYRLTLDSISRENMNVLTSNGCFTLRAVSEDKTVDYLNCFCESGSFGADIPNDKPQLTVMSYDRREIL